MRIVLDTNVLARATPGRGSPAEEVLLLALQPPQMLVTSEFLLDELARAMRYERMRMMHGLADDRINSYVDLLRTASIVVPIPVGPVQGIVHSDPDDDPIVATAVLGSADVLCTWDRHLRHPTVIAYCQQFNIRVLTDVALLPLLRQPAP